MSSELDKHLADEILLVLRHGPESTLLVLELLEEGGPVTGRAEPHGEAEVLSALRALEAENKVASERQEFLPSPEKHGGLPELRLGRDNVVWWSLTSEGRSTAERVSFSPLPDS